MKIYEAKHESGRNKNVSQGENGFKKYIPKTFRFSLKLCCLNALLSIRLITVYGKEILTETDKKLTKTERNEQKWEKLDQNRQTQTETDSLVTLSQF